MTAFRLFYATNHNRIGSDRRHPKSYVSKFSQDGMGKLRFVVKEVYADDTKIQKSLTAPIEGCGHRVVVMETEKHQASTCSVSLVLVSGIW